MTQNEDLRKNIIDAITWEPLLHGSSINAEVMNGVVTLTGLVDSYPKKMEAEKVAKTLNGVKAIVENINVADQTTWNKIDDVTLADTVIKTLEWNWKVPKEKIKITVERGWVTMEGQLNWNYQKEEALSALLNIQGVQGITNKIEIIPLLTIPLQKRIIEQHISKSWALQSCDVRVEVYGTNVSLIGTVGSIYQKEEAGRIAWSTFGISALENKLLIKKPYTSSL
jgi:osmotically-inducible protein OsmY